MPMPSLVTQLAAFLASGAVPELGGVDFVLRKADAAEVIRFNLLFFLADAGKWCGPGAGP